MSANTLSLNQIVAIFRDIATRSRIISSFGFGNTSDLNADPNIVYPLLWVEPTRNVTKDAGANQGYRTMLYGFNVYILDRINKGDSNYQELLSDCQYSLATVIAEIEQHIFYIQNNLSLTDDIYYTPVTYEYDDNVNGYMAEVKIKMPLRYTPCNNPIQNITGFTVSLNSNITEYRLVGSQGPQGQIGFQGQIGAGFQGAEGLQGSQGLIGFQGSIGEQGFQGVEGQTGLQGFQGLVGDNGVQGFQGLVGDNGVQGFQGVEGQTGLQGFQGLVGLQGSQGLQGFGLTQGLQSVLDNGPTASDVYVELLDGSTLKVDGFISSNSGYQFKDVFNDNYHLLWSLSDLINISHSNSGNPMLEIEVPSVGSKIRLSNKSTFNYEILSETLSSSVTIKIPNNSGFIPLSVNGITASSSGNITIPTGLQGAQGFQGLVGNSGAQGNQGIAGVGAQGFQGLVGNSGAQGNQGIAGVGTQGFQGLVGLQGNQGFQGNDGTPLTTTLTGFVSGYGTVSSSDTILGGIQKLDANTDLIKWPSTIRALRAGGINIVAETTIASLNTAQTAQAFAVNNNAFWAHIYVSRPVTVTGAAFIQRTQGNYTGGGYNGMALYSFTQSTTVATRIAETGNIPTIWQGSANSIQQVAFTSPASLVPGDYWVSLIYTQTALTTAPQLAGLASTAFSYQLPNGIYFAGRTTNPTASTSVTLGSALIGNGATFWVGLYT